jgi:hypothetical protein
MSNVFPSEVAVKARQETFRQLEETEIYARLARGFLELGDDAGALYAIACHREKTLAVHREFRPLRAALAPPLEHREAAE